MNKRLIMYTDEGRRNAIWMYGPASVDKTWLTITSATMDFNLMSKSHAMIRQGIDIDNDLVEGAKFLLSVHGEKIQP